MTAITNIKGVESIDEVTDTTEATRETVQRAEGEAFNLTTHPEVIRGCKADQENVTMIEVLMTR